MRALLTVYIVGGVIWWFWSKQQGYVSSFTQGLLWPITLASQIKDRNAVAQPPISTGNDPTFGVNLNTPYP